MDRERDAFERELLAAFLERDRPVLGICRGAQLINIALGGTLHQDLSDFYREVPRVRTVLPRKAVEVAAGTRLAAALGVAGTVYVNGLHHQAIDELGEGLAVAAREQAGVVQAVEGAGEHFVLGVQWHPEYLPHLHAQRRVFRALVEACRREAAGGGRRALDGGRDGGRG